MIKVLIVDDHPAIRTGTKTILEGSGMDVIIMEKIDGVINAVYNKNIDIFLIDLYMPDITGLELSKRILQINPEAKIIIYTGFDISTHFNLLVSTGVSGFVSKMATSSQLVNAIKCTLNGEVIIPLSLLKQLKRDVSNIEVEEIGIVTLTNREQKILELISMGFTNKKIADELYVSQRTIEYSLTKIYSKLKVNSRVEALQTANRFGLLSKVEVLNN